MHAQEFNFHLMVRAVLNDDYSDGLWYLKFVFVDSGNVTSIAMLRFAPKGAGAMFDTLDQLGVGKAFGK